MSLKAESSVIRVSKQGVELDPMTREWSKY